MTTIEYGILAAAGSVAVIASVNYLLVHWYVVEQILVTL